MQRLSFCAPARVEVVGHSHIRIATPWASTTLERPADHAAAIDLLSGGGADELTLCATVAAATGGSGDPRAFRAWLARCYATGVLNHSVETPSGSLLRFEPGGPLPESHRASDQPLQLSRFAYLRQDAGCLLLASPRLAGRVRLDDPLMASVIAFFARPRAQDELPPGFDTHLALIVRRLFARWGLLVPAGSEDTSHADPALRHWEFHDLLFHAASRTQPGRAAGATFRFRGELDPTPALKPPMSADLIELDRPDLEAAVTTDPPLVTVIETRRSCYHQGQDPITVRQLGHLLFRSARVRAMTATPDGELGSRPYPSSGAIYELEIYLAVDRCDGLTSGLYHYDPLHHRLERLRPRDALVEAMLKEVSRVMADQSLPQVRLLFTAKMPRLAWKYEGVAYALTLKNVGALMQTLYLNATALGLAPLAIGGGSGSLFRQATGIADHVETQVGEFIVGSRGTAPPRTD